MWFRATLIALWVNVGFAVQPHSVAMDSVESHYHLLGTWTALDWSPIKVPFDARLVNRFVRFGAHVEPGELLFELQSKSLQWELENAQLAVDEAQENLERLEAWSQSATWQQAKQELDLAKAQWSMKSKQVEDTLRLVDMGAIAKDLYHQEQMHLLRAQQQVLMAQIRFDSVNNKGGEYAIRKARLALKKAQQEMTSLIQVNASLKIRASSAGTVYAPESIQENDYPVLDSQSELAKDQIIAYMVADDSLGVVLNLDGNQMDLWERANLVEVLDTQGILYGLDIQSQTPLWSGKDSTQGGRYEIKAKAKTTFQGRLGQSVQVRLSINEPPSLTIPLQAVRWDSDACKVMLKQNASWQEQSVQLGKIGVKQAQVIAGLQEGDVVGISN